MRPIIFNIETTYQSTKYLNKLLTPLSKSDYSILNAENLLSRLREEIIHVGFKMICFDLENLFNNVPLDKTIVFILKKLFNEKKIQTKILKIVLKKLLHLCTKQ